MSIKTLAKNLMVEYQVDYETAKQIYQQRAKRNFDSIGAFEYEDILRGESDEKDIRQKDMSFA